MIRSERCGALAGAVAIVLLVCCGCPSRPAPPNLLLVSVDSLRIDHVHAAGYARETTPNIDRLIGEGTLWDAAVAPAPWTTPSMMSVMTGLSPDRHHVEEDDRVLSADVATLAERLAAAGYETAGFVPAATLSARFGFGRGFKTYEETEFGHTRVCSPAQASSVIHWIEGRRERPWFCWVHLWDPHYNYNPVEPWDRKFASSFHPAAGTTYDMTVLKNKPGTLSPGEIEWLLTQFDGEIAYTDRYIGEILETLGTKGALDHTLVVLLGDHGEAFQEHGWLTHTNTVYEETIRVPVVARLPGRIAAGRIVRRPVSLIDIAPTIAAWLGIAPVSAEGVGLADDASPAPPRLLVSQTRRGAAVLSARLGDLSLVLDYASCRAELYDLAADPAQKRDLASERPSDLAKLRHALAAWYRSERAAHPVPLVRLEKVDPDLFQKLGALGYVDLFGDRKGERTDADPLRCLERAP